MKKMHHFSTLLLIICVSISAIGQNSKQISLEDIYKDKIFKAKDIDVFYSMKDGEHYTVLDDNSIKKYSYKTGKLISTILSKSDLLKLRGDASINFEEYSFSSDETKLLIPFDTEAIYRRSSKSFYYIYNIEDKSLTPLCEDKKQMLADFSPLANEVAYVQDNNIFVKDLLTGSLKQITSDGKKNHIINGGTDWVYEEEFYLTKGFYWSPDGSKIAFYQFDESKMKEYTMLKYGEIYPEVIRFKYPVSGEENSIIQIKVYDIKTESFKTMDIGEETDIYIPRIEWNKSNTELIIIRLNRLQNKLDMLAANIQNGESEIIYTDENERYLNDDMHDNHLFIDNGNKLIVMSERSGYNHIYVKDLKSNIIIQLTKGEYDVKEILGFNPNNGLIYYLAAETSPLNRDFLTINLKGEKHFMFKKKGYYKIDFSNNFRYFINSYKAADKPVYISLHKINGKIIRVLEDNAALNDKRKEYNFGNKEFFSFKTSQGIELNACKILPKDFNPTKKYPVLMFVYGGPGSQKVLNRIGSRDNYFNYLAQQGILVYTVDNRGTGSRGEDFQKITYGELGKYETIDQVEGAKYISTLPFVDKNRIAIFGWSYGGWVSSLCLANKERMYSTAIAVAPVTHYYYYDNVWTERYMGLPKEHKSGYEDNAVLNMANDMEGNYLIIHGSGDDNVHPQNTMDMVSNLIEANKQFEMFIYPNKTHSITGGNADLHIYTQMANFLKKHLLIEKK